MSTIGEYQGEHLLHLSERAENPEDRESNEAQWARMKKQITEELNRRGITVTPWYFSQSHYKHGGVNLTVTYRIANHTVTPVRKDYK